MMTRIAILAIGAFDYILSKTGNALIRYRPDDVIAIIDPNQKGKTSDQVLGWGPIIPCVESFSDVKKMSPTHLVIGTAPQGGKLTEKVRYEILDALHSKCHIISGMHSFLNDDKELSDLAQKMNVTITDLRRPPKPPHFPKGTWENRKFPVLLIVGSDCDSGKMTTAWELTNALKKRNRRVEFIGTGQTGILLSGNGVPVDAVISDFMAGEIEYCLDQLPVETELAIVEGQGALNNMLYSGVTLGLLHGCMPDFLIFTHEPGRKLDVSDFPIPDLKILMDMHINLMNPFKESIFIGLNYLTIKLKEQLALETCTLAEDKYSLPVTDLVRFGGEDMITNIEKVIDEWN
ncbi:MAG: DUF1611 domain-containing protein [Candidatus Marinimicrobia bacterium]|jgi:uncharacterized NAD-dependent epimerase/dehydratase family protein|nr:DUF1611 domain-containing protein [Candidatus Neomarinimicrobiota bacterium]MBT3502289.1 DUF1611 domain-containing protein [Candidatus Neomarinimicrobiota bacterium]MBT3840367.1 DUF1611 domain-containing protein [Candidatus Neomarinimicrobiota bacterium]MBT3998513.1 DUF1611 domain-containing protein [Candidatus Neomarinimicrobiota bacterium]MBT4578975.1 DUF1611 domain-containing protein [Candidatus Neomarinimicrobiota bacterium]